MNNDEYISLYAAAAELGIAPDELVLWMIEAGDLSRDEGELLLEQLPAIMMCTREEGVVYNVHGSFWVEIKNGVVDVMVGAEAEHLPEISRFTSLVDELGLICTGGSVEHHPGYFGGVVSTSRYVYPPEVGV